MTSFLPRAIGGAATRLKILLEEADQAGFKDPPGMLQKGFWGTKVKKMIILTFMLIFSSQGYVYG